MTVMTNEDPTDPSAHEPKPVYAVWAESGNCIMWTTNKAQAECCAQEHKRPMRELFDQSVVAYKDVEIQELQALSDRLSDLLSRTAVALRGPEPPLTRWSWHDLPERATAAIAAIEVMQRAAQHAARNGGYQPIGTSGPVQAPPRKP
jgi:hypothetical protein